ncbi:MAG: sigma-70 family RNA polymerase sigma factor [Bacteroidota bacterium]|nr:sigma-70 family RNA polymerase sigma factor [Candidatus Kapabacteria bacterium]MDW8219300.1 sigma-70 family RNA polymerase sigma factor [Bacteroidota bacterium]
MEHRDSDKERRYQQSRNDDAELIRRAAQGEQSAFKLLEKKYRASITSLIRRMMASHPNDVDDLVQETFIKAFQALKNFNNEYAFSTWLYKIASNHCIDFLRKKRLKTFSIDQPIETKEGTIEYEIYDDSTRPDSELHSRERTALIRQAIDELPEKYRVVIQMRHEEDMDYQEIANRLGIPLGTVKAHLFRARAMLYKKLRKNIPSFY